MNRRNFLKGAAVALAATTIPFTLGRVEDKNRIVEIDTEDGWTRIEMSLLKPGDVFRIKDNGKTVMPTMKAESNPYIVQDDIWGINIY